jgi:hypothetical protein
VYLAQGSEHVAEGPSPHAKNVVLAPRVTVPFIAGGARLDIPAPYRRDESVPILQLSDTVVGFGVLSPSGVRGVQTFETVIAAYSVWFPREGRVAFFMGDAEYDPITGGYVWDAGFYQRMMGFTLDEKLVQLYAMLYGAREAIPGWAPPPTITRDPNWGTVQLAGTVFAYPIVDEFQTRGIEIFDTITQASYGWIPGRPPAIFMGYPEYDPACDCEVADSGWTRISAFTAEPVRLAYLTYGLPYHNEPPTGPPPTEPPGGTCSPVEEDCPPPIPNATIVIIPGMPGSDRQDDP